VLRVRETTLIEQLPSFERSYDHQISIDGVLKLSRNHSTNRPIGRPTDSLP